MVARWGIAVIGLVITVALAGCETDRVGGSPDRDRTTSENIGAVELAVPIELRGVTQLVPSDAPAPTAAVPESGTVLPDPDNNQLALHPAFLTLHRLDGGELEFDEASGTWLITLMLTKDDGDKFAQWTQNHVGEQVALIAEGEVIFAPQIAAPITGGEIQIAGGLDGYTKTEASDFLNDITGR